MQSIDPISFLFVQFFVIGMVMMWHGIVCLFLPNAYTYGIFTNQHEPHIAFTTCLEDFRIVKTEDTYQKDIMVNVNYAILNPRCNIIIPLSDRSQSQEDVFPYHLYQIRCGLQIMVATYPIVCSIYPQSYHINI